jgi:hypothetical protein
MVVAASCCQDGSGPSRLRWPRLGGRDHQRHANIRISVIETEAGKGCDIPHEAISVVWSWPVTPPGRATRWAIRSRVCQTLSPILSPTGIQASRRRAQPQPGHRPGPTGTTWAAHPPARAAATRSTTAITTADGGTQVSSAEEMS